MRHQQPDQHAARDRGEDTGDRRDGRMLPLPDEQRRDDRDQRDLRSDGQIDSVGDDDDRHPQRGHGDDRGVAQD